MRLLADPTPPAPPPSIDLRCCRIQDLDLRGVAPDLVIADPPWTYSRREPGGSGPEDHYDTLTTAELADLVGGLPGVRLALWITWPILAAEWPIDLPGWGRPITGGAWCKSAPGDSGHYGQGYHWAGCSEPVLVYTRSSSTTHRDQALRNAWVERPGRHSRKPVGWQRGMIRRWTNAGGLVLDPFAGLGSVAEAALLEGRRYLGAEVDPDRHRAALGLLAGARS